MFKHSHTSKTSQVFSSSCTYAQINPHEPITYCSIARHSMAWHGIRNHRKNERNKKDFNAVPVAKHQLANSPLYNL